MLFNRGFNCDQPAMASVGSTVVYGSWLHLLLGYCMVWNGVASCEETLQGQNLFRQGRVENKGETEPCSANGVIRVILDPMVLSTSLWDPECFTCIRSKSLFAVSKMKNMAKNGLF